MAPVRASIFAMTFAGTHTDCTASKEVCIVQEKQERCYEEDEGICGLGPSQAQYTQTNWSTWQFHLVKLHMVMKESLGAA